MCPTEDNIECCIAPMPDFRSPPLNMGSRKKECRIRNRNVLAKRFIPEDEDDVISLDPPPKIILDHWNINIGKMFSENKQALLSAKFLTDLVVSYKLSLRNKALFYAYSERLSDCIIHHLNYVHECFHDMEYHRISLPEATNYYSMLEDILAVYCSVELKSISKIYFKPDSNNNRECDNIIITDETMYRKRLAKRAQKIAFILHNYLHRNESVLHVLMKMWYNKDSPACAHTMCYLFTLILHEKPILDKSDESYCRYVISYLLWVVLEVEENRSNNIENMLGVLHKKFGYTNNEIPNSPFVKKVLDMSVDQKNFENLIQFQSTTIERYFLELRKSQQRRMFNDDCSIDSRPYESFLFDVNDTETNIDEPDLDPESEYSDSDSDVVEIIVLDSDEEDDVQIIPNSTDKSSILHLNTPLLSGTVTAAPTTATARSKTHRSAPRNSPHLDSITQSVLQTVADVVRKAQSGDSEQSVCANNDSVTNTYSDISDRFAAKQAQVRSRARPSVDVNSTSENVQNPYMSPPSSSIGTPDNNYPETVELEAHSPGIKCSTSAGVGSAHASTSSANLLLYTPDSQDERADQSFELQPRTPTDCDDRDGHSGLDEDHDTGQDHRKRREPHADISPTSLSKRRRVNGDISSTLLSPASMPTTSKDVTDTTESKSTSVNRIPSTSSTSKRRRRNNSYEDAAPWEREHLEPQRDDVFSNLNNERLTDSNSNSTSIKPPSPSTQSTVPEQIHPAPTPIIPKVITLNKVPPIDLNEPEYTSENGVKGLLGSDVALLSQQAVEILQTDEISHEATEITHTAYVRDKGFIQIVSQPDTGAVEKLLSAIRTSSRNSGQVEVDTEDGDGRRMNTTPSKDILKEACADLLLPDADQDETIGTTSSHHNILTHESVATTNELADNSNAAPASPCPSNSSATYPLHEFDKFEQQHQTSLSATNSCTGSIVGDEPVTLPNGYVSPTVNSDIDDRNSVQSFGSAYQTEEPLEEENIVSTSPTITAKEKHHMSKGISTLVSSSSSDPSNTDIKSLYGVQSLKDYIKTKPAYVDLTVRKRWNNKMPVMGRKRPHYLRDYSFPSSSPSLHISEVFDDDTNMCGRVGVDVRQIPISRPTAPTKGNMSYEALPFEFARNTENNSITEPLSLLYGPTSPFNSNSSTNSNIIDVSYTVSSSNDSVSLNKVIPTLTITVDIPKPEDLELEFSNSPTIFEDTTKGLLERMALQSDTPEDNVLIVSDSNLFLANNTNYYLLSTPTSYCSSTTSNACSTNVTPPIPNPVVTNTDHSINAITAAVPSSTSSALDELTPEEEEALNKLLQESMAHMNNDEYEGNGTETRLPFKKRRMSVSSKTATVEPSYQQPKRKQRSSNSNKQPKVSSTCKQLSPLPPPEISYPATKMISIAEVQEQNGRRSFKTAAERKEMPGNTTPPALANSAPFTPFYPCNGDRSNAVLNIPSYNRGNFAYPFTVPVLSAPLPPVTQAQATVASAYYSSLLTPQQFAASMISTPSIGEAVNSYACHHRLSGSVMAAATLAATTAPQTYKPAQQRRRSGAGAKREVTTSARTRSTSVQYK